MSASGAIQSSGVSFKAEPDTKAKINKVLGISDSISPSQVPFTIIHHLANHHFSSFAEAAYAYAKLNNVTSKEDFATSCLVTMRALTTLFMGKTSQQKIDLLRLQIDAYCSFSLPSKEEWTFTINNLFTGALIHEIDQRIQNDKERAEVGCNSKPLPPVRHILFFANPLTGSLFLSMIGTNGMPALDFFQRKIVQEGKYVQ